MNQKLDEYVKYIKNKKVAVLGIGISNTPLIRFLYGMGVDITAFDKAEKDKLTENIQSLSDLDIKYSLGENYLDKLKGFDVVFRTPGMRYDLPQLLKAKDEGAVITSEIEVLFDLCPSRILAITGSDGKSTTTTLIYNILREEGYKCWLGGNIGIPLLSRVGEMRESDMVVLELSSFQLHTMRKSPGTAVITNITPNHLDVHKSMEEYIDAKKNIFVHQSSEDKVVLNYDNKVTRELASQAESRVEFFSRLGGIDEGAVLKNKKLVYIRNGKTTEIVDADEIVIPGLHNIENYLAAIGAVFDLVSPQSIHKVATTFRGVEHRIELVREIKGIKFYNDSIASSPMRTIAGLNTFKQRVILIAGGKDKNNDYQPLGDVMVDKVKCLVLVGQTSPQIVKALLDAVEKNAKGHDIKIFKCSEFDQAVKAAYACAEKGDIVILSPASTSFDLFKNFEERGRKFKEVVNSLT